VGDKTLIPWSDATDNIAHGCEEVSEGCGLLRIGDATSGGCYARRLANKTYGPEVGFAVTLEPGRMAQCLQWQRPRRIFTVSMGDLFHDEVPYEFVAARWFVMGLCAGLGDPRCRRGHAFQILTKRPARLAAFMRRWIDPTKRQRMVDEAVRRGYLDVVVARHDVDPADLAQVGTWDPILPNVWLAVSVELPKYLWRIDKLLQISARTRFVSIEPLLGPVDLTHQLRLWPGYCQTCGARLQPADATWCRACRRSDHDDGLAEPAWFDRGIHQIIVGGESGFGARRMDPAWARELLAQAQAAGVAVHFKQTGEVLAREWGLRDRRGEAIGELPADLQVRQNPTGRWDPASGWQLP
jgi:protein gp37